MTFTRALIFASAAAALSVAVACSSDDDDSINPGGLCDGGPCPTTSSDAATSPVDSSTTDASKVGQACTTKADCGDTEDCGFKVSDGCTATGTCFAVSATGSTCNAISLACACDGTEVNTICTDLPDGYASQPVQYPVVTTCSDSGLHTAVPIDASSDASTD